MRNDVVVLGGSAADSTFAVSDSGALLVTNSSGATDMVSDVEHVHFNGSGETFALQEGNLVQASDSDEITDLLEGDLMSELLNVSAPETNSVDDQLNEMAALEADSTSDASAAPSTSATDTSSDPTLNLELQDDAAA